MSYLFIKSAIPQLLHWKNHSREIGFKNMYFFPLPSLQGLESWPGLYSMQVLEW